MIVVEVVGVVGWMYLEKNMLRNDLDFVILFKLTCFSQKKMRWIVEIVGLAQEHW